MTYQQYPPAGQPVVQQPGQPFAGEPTPGARRAGLIGVGALLLAAGLVAGVVMVLASSSNYDEGVQNLARAPLGCTTSLEFDEAGTYLIYIETVGTVGDLRGDCPNADTDYDYGDDDLPDVDLVLVDSDGDEVDLDDDESAEYDAAGFVGASVASVEIDEAGDFELTATSDEEDFAVAVGRNPKDTASSMRTTGIIALALGVVLGGLLIVLGMRRKPGTPSAPSTQHPQTAYQQPEYQHAPGPFTGQVPVVPPTAAPPPAFPPQPSYQPPAAPPTIPMPPTPPGPPAGGWPAPPST